MQLLDRFRGAIVAFGLFVMGLLGLMWLMDNPMLERACDGTGRPGDCDEACQRGACISLCANGDLVRCRRQRIRDAVACPDGADESADPAACAGVTEVDQLLCSVHADAEACARIEPEPASGLSAGGPSVSTTGGSRGEGTRIEDLPAEFQGYYRRRISRCPSVDAEVRIGGQHAQLNTYDDYCEPIGVISRVYDYAIQEAEREFVLYESPLSGGPAVPVLRLAFSEDRQTCEWITMEDWSSLVPNGMRFQADLVRIDPGR